MNALARRERIIERMKIRKFDTTYNLAVEFAVSRLTILRDIQELSVSGYPIQADMGRGGGIRWVGSKKQFPFTDRQMLAIHNAIAAASPEDKLVLEDMLRENVKPEVDANDIFGILSDGITQRALAAELGITESHLSRILSGQKNPSAELAERISKYRKEVLGKDEGK
jgi:biotin operon repressor